MDINSTKLSDLEKLYAFTGRQVEKWQKAIEEPHLEFYKTAFSGVKGKPFIYQGRRVACFFVGPPIYSTISFFSNVGNLFRRQDPCPIKYRICRIGLDACVFVGNLVRLAMRVAAIAFAVFEPHAAAYLMKWSAQLMQFLVSSYVHAAKACGMENASTNVDNKQPGSS